MLFWIVLVPFSSALNSHYGGLNGVWIWYSFNMFMIAICMYFIWRYIGNPKRKLSFIANDPRLRKMSLERSFTVAFIFLCGVIFSLWEGEVLFIVSRFIYILIIPAMGIINRRYRIKKDPT